MPKRAIVTPPPPGRQRAVEAPPETQQPRQKRNRHKRRNADPDLDDAKHPVRVPCPVDPPPGRERSQGQTRQERRHDGSDGVDVGLHKEDQHAHPYHLVGQGSEALDAEHPQGYLHGVGQGLAGRSFLRLRLWRFGFARLLPAEPPVQEQRSGRYREVQQRGLHERARYAQQLDQRVAGQNASGERSQVVRRVKSRHIAAKPLRLPDVGPGEHRQSPSHQRRRDQQHRETEPEAHQGHDVVIVTQRPVESHVERLQRRRDQREQQSERADAHLQQRKQHQRPPPAVNEPTQIQAAQRQARHERGHHGAGGVDCHAEDQRKLLRPDNLLDEGRHPGKKEHGEHQGGCDSRRSGSCVRFGGG